MGGDLLGDGHRSKMSPVLVIGIMTVLTLTSGSPWPCPHYWEILFPSLQHSPHLLTYLQLYESTTDPPPPPVSAVAPPFGLLWYFAVYSVASRYCVNKFSLIYTKNQTSCTRPSSDLSLVTRGAGLAADAALLLIP